MRLMKWRRAGRCLVALLALGGATACSTPEEHLASVVAENQSCTSDGQCVLVGGSDCKCPAVVNAAGQDEVQEAMAGIPCCDIFGGCFRVECAAFATIGCQEGRCRGE